MCHRPNSRVSMVHAVRSVVRGLCVAGGVDKQERCEAKSLDSGPASVECLTAVADVSARMGERFRPIRRLIQCLLLVSLSLLVGRSDVSGQEQPSTRQHPLVPALKKARESAAVLAKVKDYECQFTRREFVKNQLITHQMLLRLRHNPFSVYLKYISPSPGREVLYVDGKNQGQLLAHEASGILSLAGTISLAVDSPKVMAESRHPITEIGMQQLIQRVIAQWELESKYGETDVKFYPDAKLGQVPCEVIEVSHPRPRKQFLYHKSRVYFDKTSQLPIRIENYGFPQPGQNPQLLEEYTYTNIKLNNGFRDADFDRNNPQFSF